MTSLPSRPSSPFRVALAIGLALVGCLRAADVVLLRQIQRVPTRWTTQATIDQTLDRVRRRLKGVGVETETVDDARATGDAFAGCRLVVLPYNPAVPADATGALVKFVEGGGKVVCFYHVPEVLRPLLGIGELRYKGAPDLPKLAGIRFKPGALAGGPEGMAQASWNINEPELAPGKGARIAATWIGSDGKDTGLTALTLHPNGAFLDHIYLDEDPTAGGRFLLALLGSYLPELWNGAVQAQLDQLSDFAGVQDLADLAPSMAGASKAATDAYAKANRRRREAQQFLKEGKQAEALALAEEASVLARKAYLASRPPRDHELRGAWIHSAYGVSDWGWDRSVKVLADNGFNALFVNMCWGAVADYESEVLPVHPDVATRGDQIEACLAACRKYGIELHVWKVNWNMGHRTPKAIREKMIADGRTQVDLKGEASTFLAPHLEANFRLERDAMLEIVRKYPVDGIHFDYIRYPNDQCDFSASARKAFTEWLGEDILNWPDDCASGGKLRDKYNEWRRGNITRLVRTVSKDAHRIRPGVQVSAAVFGGWQTTRDSIAQDTVQWLDEGLLDFVCPMDYTTSDSALAKLIQIQEPLTPARVPLYIGLGAWRHDGPAQTADQIQLARRLGADGFVCFAHNVAFAERTLPNLAEGVTSEPAAGPSPHQSIKGSFAMPKPDRELGNAFRVGDRLHVEFELPETVDRATWGVDVELDGRTRGFGQYLRIREGKRRIRIDLRPPEPGNYRLVISGDWFDGERDAKPQPFFARSRTVHVLSPEEAEALLAKQRPPDFLDNGGIKVAVWQDDAYGAAPILELLQQTPGMDAAALWNLERESLASCQVIVLCQPRVRLDLFKSKDTVDELRRFVERGGGLVTNHALVGVRGFLPPIPEVATGGKQVEGETWKATGYHAVTRTLDRRQTYTSTFPDRISVEVGRQGRVIASTPEGDPIVVIGHYGRGRYMACGLGMGIGKGDGDAPVSEAEAKLLVGAIPWLVRK